MASTPLNYYDLLETFPTPGCTICNLCERDVNRFLDSHLYEYVNAPPTHIAMRASRFLCSQHAPLLVDYGASVLGVSILEASVIGELLKIAAQPSGSGAFARLRGNTLADRLEPETPCMACEKLEHAQSSHTQTLAGYITDERIQAGFREADGLCLPHFQMTLRAAPNTASHELLVNIQMEHWQKLKTELETFANKYDINHADEAMGEEGDSWRRAIELLSGRAGLFNLRPPKA